MNKTIRDLEVIKLLLDNGADVNIRSKNGETALILAAKYGDDPEVITTLIDHGAHVNARDKNGKTAWNYIQGNKALKNTDAYHKLNDLRIKLVKN